MSRMTKAAVTYAREISEGLTGSAFLPWQMRWRVLRTRDLD